MSKFQTFSTNKAETIQIYPPITDVNQSQQHSIQNYETVIIFEVEQRVYEYDRLVLKLEANFFTKLVYILVMKELFYRHET